MAQPLFDSTEFEEEHPWVLNVDYDTVTQQVRENAARGLQQCTPHAVSEGKLVLLCGGPSLNDFEDEIRAAHEQKIPLICCNNTYNWCLDRGIKPQGVVVVDAQAHNVRFVQRVIPGCKYLLASQCHPSVFDAVPPEQTWIWHSATTEDLESTLDSMYKKVQWYSVAGGQTVALRAIMLLRMLGWMDLEIYGFDSCLMQDEHHAYTQPENDEDCVIDVTVGNKTFKCHPWMALQAKDFEKQYDAIKHNTRLNVHGSGLIAHYLYGHKNQQVTLV